MNETFDYEALQKKISSIPDITDRRTAFLKDTIEFYNSNNRATTTEGCIYRATYSSPGCAIGRCLPRDSKVFERELVEHFCNVDTLIEKEIELPQWLLDMDDGVRPSQPVQFLGDVQGLHDTEYYWDEDGLSVEGKRETNEIISKYKLDMPLFKI